MDTIEQASIRNVFAALHGPLVVVLSEECARVSMQLNRVHLNCKLKEVKIFSALEEGYTCKAPVGLHIMLY